LELSSHISKPCMAMPTQSSKKRTNEPYSNSEMEWLLEIYDKNLRLSAQELGERLNKHVNSKRSANLVLKRLLDRRMIA
jgi:phage-related protein